MLTLAEWKVQFPDGIRVHPEMGSVFHGALMEIIGEESAALYHSVTLRPYSQAIYWDRQRQAAIWRIGTLTDDAYERILVPLQSCHSLHLQQKGYDVTLSDFSIRLQTMFDKLAESLIQSETAPQGATWDIRTVMSFKQQGRFVILPDIRLLYQSLLQRWNAFSQQTKLEDERLLDQLTAHCRLTKYQLQSQVYSVNGSPIYGCSGQMRYQFFGFDMLKRIQGILASFAPYAGVGVKTALGMGAVTTTLL